MAIEAFETRFAVPLHCESCVETFTTAINGLTGIQTVSADLDQQTVTVLGTAPPSQIVKAIQDTGKDAILRGSGKENSAAVCILETHEPNVDDPVRGLARMVQVSDESILIDMTVKGIPPGNYRVTLRTAGDISRGAASTGDIWEGETGRGSKLGSIEIGENGSGSSFVVLDVQVWEIVGRSILVSSLDASAAGVGSELVGVIARSAGVWENDKTVCSCSGKTLWEERKEHVGRGMM